MKRHRMLQWLMAAGLTAILAPSAEGQEGHCDYQQHAPWLKRWVPACQMPISQKACEELAMNRYKGSVKFGEGECAARNVTAVCVVGSEKIFFYGGDVNEYQIGCEKLQGSWRPDLMPTAEETG